MRWVAADLRAKFLQSQRLRDWYRRSTFVKWMYRCAARAFGHRVPSVEVFAQPGQVSIRLRNVEFTFRSNCDADLSQARALREAGLFAELVANIAPNDLVWDVGANIGLYSILLAQTANRGRVIAFEPNKSCYDRLVENIRANELTNVSAERFALADVDGEIPFVDDGVAASTVGHLLREPAANDARCTIVECCRADAYLLRPGSSVPNIVKIDVEGFEYEVLNGFRQGLQRPEVRAVFVEIHSRLLAERGRRGAIGDICELLSAAGFETIDWIDASHIVAKNKGGRTRSKIS